MALTFLLAFLTGVSGWAQIASTGDLRGLVLDSSGVPIAMPQASRFYKMLEHLKGRHFPHRTHEIFVVQNQRTHQVGKLSLLQIKNPARKLKIFKHIHQPAMLFRVLRHRRSVLLHVSTSIARSPPLDCLSSS